MPTALARKPGARLSEGTPLVNSPTSVNIATHRAPRARTWTRMSIRPPTDITARLRKGTKLKLPSNTDQYINHSEEGPLAYGNNNRRHRDNQFAMGPARNIVTVRKTRLSCLTGSKLAQPPEPVPFPR